MYYHHRYAPSANFSLTLLPYQNFQSFSKVIASDEPLCCRRLEKEKEKQELIRQGLLEPPKPKVKLSTFHRSMGAEASMDPTAVEARVRADQDARQQVVLLLLYN